MRHDPIDPGDFGGIGRPAVAARVAERMTRDVVTVRWDEPVARASSIMEERQIGHLLVVNARRRLVGLVTAGDLREALVVFGRRDPAVAPRTAVVGFAMTADPVTVTPACALGEAVALMRTRKLSALPVVHGEQVVGILTRDDLLRELAHTLDGELQRAS